MTIEAWLGNVLPKSYYYIIWERTLSCIINFIGKLVGGRYYGWGDWKDWVAEILYAKILLPQKITDTCIFNRWTRSNGKKLSNIFENKWPDELLKMNDSKWLKIKILLKKIVAVVIETESKTKIKGQITGYFLKLEKKKRNLMMKFKLESNFVD